MLPRAQRTAPEDRIDSRYRGIALPLIKKPRGFFQSMFSRDVIRSSIYMILSTGKGERVCVPEYGSDLRKALFEPNDFVTRNLVKLIATADVNRWEPRVNVENVRVNSKEHEISVIVTYSIIGADTIDATTISFSTDGQTVSFS